MLLSFYTERYPQLINREELSETDRAGELNWVIRREKVGPLIELVHTSEGLPIWKGRDTTTQRVQRTEHT
jgi:hypothetical protein